MNYLVLLAGGIGSRLSLNIPKQFYEVNNKPIFEYTLDKFINNKNVDSVVIVVSNEWKEYVNKRIKNLNSNKPISIADAGTKGLLSAYNGYQYIKNNSSLKDDDLIIFHDAARPFVDEDTINNNIEVAKKYGNAVATIDLSETLIKVEKDSLSSNNKIDRDNLKRVLTPHTFSFASLNKFFEDKKCIEKSNIPSIFAYFMSLGNKIYYTNSSERNFKITYDNDLLLAVQLLSK